MTIKTRKLSKMLFAAAFCASVICSLAPTANAAKHKSHGAFCGTHPGSYGLPKFGFSSRTIFGVGENVTFVRHRGIASDLGLEIGDTILAVNGWALTYHGAWNDALRNAMYNGGHVQLTIRDVRTGNIVYRTIDMGGGHGPVTPKSAPVVHYGGQASGPVSHYSSTPSTGPVTQKSIVAPKLQSSVQKLFKSLQD